MPSALHILADAFFRDPAALSLPRVMGSGTLFLEAFLGTWEAPSPPELAHTLNIALSPPAAVVVLAGELAANEECAVMLYRSGAVFMDVDEEDEAAGRGVRSLYSLITEKQHDDEFVLQLLFAFYR